MSRGRTSRITRRISAGFERSSWSRLNATTSPNWGKSCKSSLPTWPFFPVSNMTGFIAPHTSAGIREELEKAVGNVRLLQILLALLRPILFLDRDHSRRSLAHLSDCRIRCTCRGIEPCQRELGNHARSQSERKSDSVIRRKVGRLPIFRSAVTRGVCQLRRPELLLLPLGKASPGADAADSEVRAVYL